MSFPSFPHPAEPSSSSASSRPCAGPSFSPSRRSVLAGTTAVGTVTAGAALGLGATAADHAHAEPADGRALGPLADVARWNEQGVGRFRIPALTRTNDGALLAVFDARTSMDDLPAKGIHTFVRRSDDEGRSWGPYRTLRADPLWSTGDPSILTDRETGTVLVFTTASQGAGFGNSGTGNDPTDPGITQLELATSTDDGLTWTHRRITEQVKDPAWAGMFACSGEGVQLRHGKHRGRLLQQYVVRIDGENWAVTAYSDDHGKTWQHGEPAGPGADENKVCERSDGSVLLNSRAGGHRWQAISTDGGLTYSSPREVPEQIDPANNGQVTRVFPDARQGSAKAKVLALSSTLDPSIRRRLSLSLSFDDGETWTSQHLLDDDASAYSTITPFGDGRLGLLYEREAYATISYRTIDVAALAPAPLLLEMLPSGHGAGDDGTEGPSATPPTLRAGTRTRLRVRATNQGIADLTHGHLALEGQDGIRAARTTLPTLAPGRSRIIELTVSTPDTLAGNRAVTLKGSARTGRTPLARGSRTVHAARAATAKVTRAGGAADHPALEVVGCFDACYPDQDAPGLEGDTLAAWARVRNTGNVALSDVRVTSDAGGTGASIDRLEPGESSTITGRTALAQVLTDDDVSTARTRVRVTASAGGGTTASAEASDTIALDLAARPAAGARSPIELPTGDLRTSAFARIDGEEPTAGALPDGTPLTLTVPAGGRTSVQLVVTAPRTGRLDVDADGPASWSGHLVETINVVEPGGHPTGGRTGDPLTPLPARISRHERRSVWCTVEVPSGVRTGLHETTLTVRIGRRTIAAFPLRLTVPSARLDTLADRPFTLDLWWHPDAIADQQGLTVFSEKHWRACRPYLEDLASRGQSVVNAVIIADPWLVENEDGSVGPQTASHYASLVDWAWDGTAFSFGFGAFDRCVEEHHRAGIDGPIHLFALLQFRLGQRLTFTDTRTGETVTEEVELGDERYREAWGALLNDLHAHLVERGWWDRAALAFDERPADLMTAVFDVVHDVAPMWDEKTALAANSLAEADIATYISFNHSFLDQVPADLIAERRAQHEPTLFYTFYDPVRPNTVTASPPMSSRMLGWEGGPLRPRRLPALDVQLVAAGRPGAPLVPLRPGRRVHRLSRPSRAGLLDPLGVPAGRPGRCRDPAPSTRGGPGTDTGRLRLSRRRRRRHPVGMVRDGRGAGAVPAEAGPMTLAPAAPPRYPFSSPA
ncbi:hypothetical protein DEO23_09815 [Brachybacterium endophyticum]|uniref:exo-alpha-sialidase n=1 Tax=Brachybacterium endophyticum TaxID=2182385 RepID=A0A2U2RJQ6_9MICO|nr:sialidase family protein [Brachybacterium endophyticum]PWH06098.1 hypothetical protein DEO23_09815 [Brachybacterium endophyticum]